MQHKSCYATHVLASATCFGRPAPYVLLVHSLWPTPLKWIKKRQSRRLDHFKKRAMKTRFRLFQFMLSATILCCINAPAFNQTPSLIVSYSTSIPVTGYHEKETVKRSLERGSTSKIPGRPYRPADFRRGDIAHQRSPLYKSDCPGTERQECRSNLQQNREQQYDCLYRETPHH